MGPIFLVTWSLGILWFIHWIFKWRNPSFNGKLPPGSMGFPLLGETISFFFSYFSSCVYPFVEKRIQRYGPVFKTNLFGHPIIVSTDNELNQFVFQQEGRLFQVWFPGTVGRHVQEKDQAVALVDKSIHKLIRSLILSNFGVENLKENLLPTIDDFARETLSYWATLSSLELKDAASSVALLGLVSKMLIGYDKESRALRKQYDDFIKGFLAFPIRIPGTAYYKGQQGRNTIMKLVKNKLEERLTSPKKLGMDMFDCVINEVKKEGSLLTEVHAIHLMLVMILASYETTSQSLTMIIKNLTDHPQVLERLTEEHEGILRRRENPDSVLTWEDYKSMTFTSQVINETLRLANIAPLVLRKSLNDVNFKGYTIPAGWLVWIWSPAIHLSPTIYKDPLTFNPWRWEGMDASGSKNFIAFGTGPRQCPGASFIKVQVTVLLHYLVTKYRWVALKGGETTWTPFLTFPNGFHIRVFEKQNADQ